MPETVRKGCAALALQFHSSPEFFLSMQMDDVNEYADMAKTIWEGVKRGRGKK